MTVIGSIQFMHARLNNILLLHAIFVKANDYYVNMELWLLVIRIGEIAMIYYKQNLYILRGKEG